MFNDSLNHVVIVMVIQFSSVVLSFHGTIQAGGVVAGCYSTNEEETCLYLAENSNAKFGDLKIVWSEIS